MNHHDLVDRCKAIIHEAYEEATEMIVAYLETHPKEQLRPLCREIDPENWNALRNRVQRAQVARKAAAGTGSSGSAPWIEKRGRRAAKQVLGDPKQVREVIADLPDEVVEQVVAAAQEEQTTRMVYPDQAKPKFQDAKRRSKAKQAKRAAEDPFYAISAFGSQLASARGAIRMLVQDYQEFMALVEDEEARDYTSRRLVTFRADVDLALGEVLNGSIEEAFARLIEEEVGK